MISDNDVIVAAGEAFTGSMVVDGVGSQRSVAGIYNPLDSGKDIYVDRLWVAITNGATRGADISVIPAAMTTVLSPAVIANKKAGGASSVAELRYANVPGVWLPGSPPVFEIWTENNFKDHTYPLEPAFLLPPGWSLIVRLADDAAYAVVTWAFREKPTAGPARISDGEGTIYAGNTQNAGEAFDAALPTFASLSTNQTLIHIGKQWSSPKLINRFRMASPLGRSFTGAFPGHTLTWYLEGSNNGTNWTQIATGSYVEAHYTLQECIDRPVDPGVAYLYHRVRLVDGVAVGFRLAQVAFWEA